MNFHLPVYARRLLEGQHLEEAEADAVRLGVRLREPPSKRWLRSVSDERPVMAKLLRDAGSDTGKLVEIVDCLHALTNTGTNDPRLENSAGPWLWLIERLIVLDPAVAAKGARSWYRSIFMASLNLEDGLANRPFIANLAGLTAAHAHEDVKAEHHLMSGQVEAEGAEEDETAPFLCACRRVRTALRAGSGPTCAPR